MRKKIALNLLLMNKGTVKLKKDLYDQTIEGIGYLGLVFLLVIPILYYEKLPNQIPRHFDISGAADQWSGKGFIWVLPIIGTVLFFGMQLLNRFPNLFNYPVKVTEKNKGSLRSNGSKMIRTLNAIITCVFAYATFVTIQTALGNMNGLGKGFSSFFMLIIFCPTAIFIFLMLKKKELN